MSDETSARPNLLQNFVDDYTPKVTSLNTSIEATNTAFGAFLQNDGTGTITQGGLNAIQTYVGAISEEVNEALGFVQMIHAALTTADVPIVDGVATLDNDAMQARLDWMAEQMGTTWNDVSSPTEVKVDPDLVEIGTVPDNSGFVNDPVCTATGHLVVDTNDFAMPDRLEVLSFRRTYASIDLVEGAFGPGWWTWTECRAEVTDDGAFRYFGPDALRFDAPPDGYGGLSLIHI